MQNLIIFSNKIRILKSLSTTCFGFRMKIVIYKHKNRLDNVHFEENKFAHFNGVLLLNESSNICCATQYNAWAQQVEFFSFIYIFVYIYIFIECILVVAVILNIHILYWMQDIGNLDTWSILIMCHKNNCNIIHGYEGYSFGLIV